MNTKFFTSFRQAAFKFLAAIIIASMALTTATAYAANTAPTLPTAVDPAPVATMAQP